jgi:hypothetical protein
MKFFMPDWDDRVDPTFDFGADAYALGRDVDGDVYAHEILRTPPYDGILMSRAVVEKGTRRFEEILRQQAHAYFRLPETLEVFGDCGAFSYVNEDKPWYETEDVLEYYDAIGVDYGASVDHLVVSTIYVTQGSTDSSAEGAAVGTERRVKVSMSEDESQRRMDLTIDNAREFLRLHRERGYGYVPVGVAQGWNPDTYAHSVRELLEMGYTSIALGGLARSHAAQVLAVVKAVSTAIQESCSRSAPETALHLFGVAKLGLVGDLRKHGVTSIDSASYLRKAWLRSGQNYLGPDGNWYTAIRIPQSYHPRVQEYIRENGKSLDEVQEQEHYCLKALQRYSDSGLPDSELDSLLESIVDYDAHLLRFGDDGQQLRNREITKERYRRSLEARPWEKCSCGICTALGVHVLIFRGTNRNKRRGFHNTWTFYQRLIAASST